MSDSTHRWASVIRRAIRDDAVDLVIKTINGLTGSAGSINNASLMSACAQILAQSITKAPPDIAPEVRAGIMELIDGYAMQDAVSRS